jgi:hypothetical protein
MSFSPVRFILIAAAAVLVIGLLVLGGLRLSEKSEPERILPDPSAALPPPPEKAIGRRPTPTPPPVARPTEPAVAISGDGFGSIEIAIDNGTESAVTRSWGPGDSFESSVNRMLVADRHSSEVPPLMRTSVALRAYPMTAGGRPTRRVYQVGEPIEGDLKRLAEAIADDSAISPAVARSAVLMLSDNPPLDVFAMFPRPQHAISPDLDLESFRVPTSDLVDALAMMKRLGLPWQNLQVATDLQFPIEAMYGTESHDKAAAFFGIARAREWVFWKRLLLHGPPSLRHYALFGIARYFPDIAILMHPGWVNATHLPYIFRVTAVRSLAITDRSEAIPLLRRVRRDWSGDAEMVRSAEAAIAYLLWKTYRAAPPAQRAGNAEAANGERP